MEMLFLHPCSFNSILMTMEKIIFQILKKKVFTYYQVANIIEISLSIWLSHLSIYLLVNKLHVHLFGRRWHFIAHDHVWSYLFIYVWFIHIYIVMHWNAKNILNIFQAKKISNNFRVNIYKYILNYTQKYFWHMINLKLQITFWHKIIILCSVHILVINKMI